MMIKDNITFNALKKIYGLLTSQERKKAFLLFLFIVIMALLDTIGIASVMPFMAVLSNQDLLHSNLLISGIYHFFEFTNYQQFLYFLGFGVFFLFILSLGFKAYVTRTQIRFALFCETSISKRLIGAYLSQPYVWFLDHHSAELGKSILTDVNNVIYNGLFPLMIFCSQAIVTFFLICLLLVVNPFLAIQISLILGTAYIIIYKAMRKSLSKIGGESIIANRERFTAVSEAFGAIKEIKFGGHEEIYIRKFNKPAKTYAESQASLQIIAQMPRYLLEAISFGGMLLIVLILMRSENNFVDIIPIIALYAFAGYRLMPALQQAYHSLSQINFTSIAIDKLYFDLKNYKQLEDKVENKINVQLKKVIQLDGVEFSYPSAIKPSIRKTNLTIQANTSVGIVGLTGGGKTTLVDLIMGLLEPKKGVVKVDGEIINDSNRRSWQKNIGYVPQQIHLLDDTIIANIALGVAPNEVNRSKVEAVAKMANLHDFIVNALPNGYSTRAGERGIRFSGGQRQRLGIARSLYHNPQLLILDEATSSLDNITENLIINALKNLGKELTIIIIAHRLSTVRHCDKIIIMDKGVVINSGSYEDLLRLDKNFQRLNSGPA